MQCSRGHNVLAGINNWTRAVKDALHTCHVCRDESSDGDADEIGAATSARAARRGAAAVKGVEEVRLFPLHDRGWRRFVHTAHGLPIAVQRRKKYAWVRFVHSVCCCWEATRAPRSEMEQDMICLAARSACAANQTASRSVTVWTTVRRISGRPGSVSVKRSPRFPAVLFGMGCKTKMSILCYFLSVLVLELVPV